MYHLEQEFAISQSQLGEELELQVKLCGSMTDDLLINGEVDINLCLSVAVLHQINMDHLQWSVAQYLSIHCQIQFLVY